MHEHEQIMALIRAKNESPMPRDPHRTALIVVDRRGSAWRQRTRAGRRT
jgi:hypothetical protein